MSEFFCFGCRRFKAEHLRGSDFGGRARCELCNKARKDAIEKAKRRAKK